MQVEAVGRLDELPLFITNEHLRCKLEDRGIFLSTYKLKKACEIDKTAMRIKLNDVSLKEIMS